MRNAERIQPTLTFTNVSGRVIESNCALADSAETVFTNAQKQLITKPSNAMFTPNGSTEGIDIKGKSIGEVISQYGTNFAIANAGDIQGRGL